MVQTQQDLEKGDIVDIHITDTETAFHSTERETKTKQFPGEQTFKAKIGREALGNFGTAKELVEPTGEPRVDTFEVGDDNLKILLRTRSKYFDSVNTDFVVRMNRYEFPAEVTVL
jgi:hypothetical protein